MKMNNLILTKQSCFGFFGVGYMASYTDIVSSLKQSLNMANGETSIEQFKTFLIGALVDASYYDGFSLPTSRGNYVARSTDRVSGFGNIVREIIKPAQTPDECLILLQAEKIYNRGYKGA